MRKILSLTVLAIVIGLVFGAALALLTEAIDATLITLGLK